MDRSYRLTATMHTYRIDIVIGGREQRLLIRADRCLDGTHGSHIFELDGRTIAWVPSRIIVNISES